MNFSFFLSAFERKIHYFCPDRDKSSVSLEQKSLPLTVINFLKIMRKRTREKIIDLTLAILEGLLRIGEGTFDAFIDQKSFYKKLKGDNFASREITNRVRGLINRGYIEAVEESGKTSIRLTRKGKIKRLEKTTDNRIDGKWRFISFDIPERLKSLRRSLTRYLRRIGFRPVQKSLWASPFVKADDVDLIVKELGLEKYVAYFVVEKTDIKQHLEELFDDLLD